MTFFRARKLFQIFVNTDLLMNKIFYALLYEFFVVGYHACMPATTFIFI